jgi:DNA-binding CsgD family transcriptional regulator
MRPHKPPDMTSGYHALTEKEKETLRLLVSGYDAKSTARQLGLSVHTINERLRDARRKMSVSSSREAARLAREIECQSPELSGDKPLGDAPINLPLPSPVNPDAKSGKMPGFGWVIGGVIMSVALALLAYGSLFDGAPTPAVVSPIAAQSTTTSESAPVQATRVWLALVDAGDWQSSWQSTGESFRKLNTVETWTSASLKVRTPLGAVVSRELISEDNVPTPPTGNIVVKFRTSFTGKTGALETLALSREDGVWKVVGYFID